MWSELLQIFTKGNPMQGVAQDFRDMYQTTWEMAKIVEPHVFEHSLPLEDGTKVYKLDITVNRLERSIRKRVVSHLVLGRGHVPYGLLMMTLVKDVERIGDYVKNLVEVKDLGGSSIPAGPVRSELEEIVSTIMGIFTHALDVMESKHREKALELIQTGRSIGKRCDKLLPEIAKGGFEGPETTAMVLLARFYKRICSHLVNILSSVIMPLHKVDFYDERVLESGQLEGE